MNWLWFASCAALGGSLVLVAPAARQASSDAPKPERAPVGEGGEVAPTGPIDFELPSVGDILARDFSVRVANRADEPLGVVFGSRAVVLGRSATNALLVDASVDDGYQVVTVEAATARGGVAYDTTRPVYVRRDGDVVRRVTIEEWHDAIGGAAVDPQED